MRVTCEQCKAVYAVDDKLIPAKGARAQCPKCKALQIVRKPEAGAAPVAAAPAAPSPRPAPAPVAAAPRPAAPAPAPKPAAPSGPPLVTAPRPTAPAAITSFPSPAPAAPKPAAASSALDDLLGLVAASPPSTARPAAPKPSAADPFADLGPTKPDADPFAGIATGPANVAVGDPFGGLEILTKPAPAKPAAADPFASFGGPAPKTEPAADPFASFGGPAPKSEPAADPFAAFGNPAKPQPSADPFAALAAPAAPKAAPSADPFASLGAPAAPKSAASADPFAAIPTGGPAAFGDLFPPAPARAAPAPAPAGPVVPCRVCKKPLPDPFDAALGVCEDCRNDQQRSGGPPADGVKPKILVGGAAAKSEPWKPEAGAAAPADAAGGGAGGLDLDFTDRAAGQTAKPPPPQSAASAAAAVAAAAIRVAQRPAPPRPVSRPGRGGSGKTIALVLVLLALVGAAAFVVVTRPAFLFKKEVKKAVLPAVEARLTDWKLAAIGMAGTASEHVAKGRKAFLADKPASYLEAEDEFKAATVVDPTDVRTIAYYVEAYAVGRGERAPDQGIAQARELIDAVLSAHPDLALARRAHAALLLAMGQGDAARAEAEEAVKLAPPEEIAEAALMLGCTYLKKSAPIAQERIETALKQDKSLKRAWYYRGLANEYAGRYASALNDFGERLKLDPDQREALREQARVYAKLGDYQSARKALAVFASKHPTVGEPRVLLVQLAYVVERDLKEAEKTLRELKQDEARFDDSDRLQLHTLWSAVSRERGDVRGAIAQADEALALDANWAPAHFQKMLAHLAAGEADKARSELASCETRLDDPSRAKEYKGRIDLVAGDLDAAVNAFRESVDLGPGRIAPRLSLGAALVKKGELDQAWSSLRKALDVDPTSVARQKRQVSDFWEAPVDGIRGVDKVIESGHDEANWLPQVYAAVAQYHLGELDKPQVALERALQADPISLAALLYLSQIELDRKRYDKALVYAKRATEAERQCAVTFYLQGRADEGLKHIDQARAEYLQALERDPSMAPAGARVGAINATEDAEGAKKWLLQALTADPENLEARVALFKLGY